MHLKLLLPILGLYFISCQPSRRIIEVQKPQIDIDSVVKEVAHQYNQAKNDLKNGFGIDLQIIEAAVTVKVAITNSAGIDLQLLIFKLSHKQKLTKASTLTFDLKQVEPSPSKSPGMAIEPLSTFIIEAARKFNNISNNNIPELQKDNFEIDIAFTVEIDTNGTVLITPTLSNDVNGDRDKSVEHDLKLVFKIKKIDLKIE